MEAGHATAILADVVLVVHALIAAFIAAGFVVVPLGARLGWRLARRFGLRLAHLLGILFVAAETALGYACPLTVWEDALRGGGADAGFVARWVQALLYYDVPLWVFGAIYVVAAVVALAFWVWIPPQRASAGKRPPR